MVLGRGQLECQREVLGPGEEGGAAPTGHRSHCPPDLGKGQTEAAVFGRPCGPVEARPGEGGEVRVGNPIGAVDPLCSWEQNLVGDPLRVSDGVPCVHGARG